MLGFLQPTQVQCRIGVWFLKDRGYTVLPLGRQDPGLQFGNEPVASDALKRGGPGCWGPSGQPDRGDRMLASPPSQQI